MAHSQMWQKESKDISTGIKKAVFYYYVCLVREKVVGIE